ncbi:2-oxoglutarate dehydrogenase E1 subunit family protein, partial [Sporosarcina koreensis]
MSNNVGTQRSPYSVFSGPNLGYVMEMYEQFKVSPESVDPELAEMFRSYGAPSIEGAEQTAAMTAVPASDFGKVLAAYTLVDAIRAYGHLASDI